MTQEATVFERVGIVLFDNQQTPLEGSASIGGAQPFRVDSMQSLRSDVLWITNLPFNVCRAARLINSPNVADEQFLRTKLSVIAEDVGFMRSADAARALALIATRIFNLSQEVFGVGANKRKYRFSKSLTPALLPPDIGMVPPGGDHAIITHALTNATQENQASSGVRIDRSHARITLSFPRLSYAKWLCDMRVANGQHWRRIVLPHKVMTLGKLAPENSKQDVAANTQFIRNFLRDKAALFRVRVKFIDSFHATFATFGASGVKSSGVVREWAPALEVLEMANYSHIEVLDGYETESGPIAVPDFLSPNLQGDDFSYSAGLLAENAWVAMASADNGGTTISPFVRAIDRIACLRVAAMLARFRFTIGSFGAGRIVVFAEHEHVYSLCVRALHYGLLPPVSVLSSPGFLEYAQKAATPNERPTLPAALINRIDKDRLLLAIRTMVSNGALRAERVMALDALLGEHESNHDHAIEKISSPMGRA